MIGTRRLSVLDQFLSFQIGIHHLINCEAPDVSDDQLVDGIL